MIIWISELLDTRTMEEWWKGILFFEMMMDEFRGEKKGEHPGFLEGKKRDRKETLGEKMEKLSHRHSSIERSLLVLLPWHIATRSFVVIYSSFTSDHDQFC